MANSVTTSFKGICRNNLNVYYNFTFKITETETIPATNSSKYEYTCTATQMGTYTGVDRDVATTITIYIGGYSNIVKFDVGLLQKGFSNTITKTNYYNHNSDGTGSLSIKFLSGPPNSALMERNVYESSKDMPQNLTLNLTPIDRTANGCSVSLVSKTSDSVTCKIHIPWEHSIDWHSTDGQNFTYFNLGGPRNSGEFIDTWSNLTPNTTYTFYYKIRRQYNYIDSDIFSITVTTNNQEQATGYIKVNGEWKKGKLFYKSNGQWQKVKKAYMKENGAWKETK